MSVKPLARVQIYTSNRKNARADAVCSVLVLAVLTLDSRLESCKQDQL